MRKISLAVLFAISLRAEGGSFVLDVKIASVPTREILRERCGGREACTRFVSERLSAGCAAQSGVWSLKVDAFSVALLYGINSSRLAHETLHITDMRSDVTRHLRQLEATVFPTEESCTATAKNAASNFSATMKQFAIRSMAKRH